MFSARSRHTRSSRRPGGSAAALRVAGVDVRFGDHHAVKDVSLALGAGRTLALLGPSGCGKTTLLNVIAGFVTPAAGHVELDGRDVTNVPTRRRGLAMVFQNHALFPHLSVAENVAFGLKVRRLPPDEIARRVADALALVRLDGLQGRYPRQISGGQQQRVSLARALVVEPSILLLDEPLSSLDAELRAEMRLELRELKEATDITMVYVTHDREEAFALGDDLGVMRDGELLQIGPPADVVRAPAAPFVASFLNGDNLVSGRVLGRTARGTCEVELSGQGGAPHVLEAPAVPGLAAGAPVTLALPRAAIRVALPGRREESTAGTNSVPAEFKVMQYMGDRASIVCELHGRRINVTTTLDALTDLRDVAARGPIELQWPVSDGRLYPEAGGRLPVTAEPAPLSEPLLESVEA